MRAIALGFIALVGAAACGAAPTPVDRTLAPTLEPTVLPTQAALPTPNPSPEPSPSLPSTPPPPPTQPPTSTLAGQRLLPFYFDIRRMFSALPPVAYILPDEPISTDPNAIFYGLAPDGVPQFAVRANFVMDKDTAAHEIGHAYEKVLERAGPGTRDVMALYWSFRGFPGTWQEALKQSQLETTAAAKWALNPYESWAEAFRAAVMLEATEKTEDYKKPIDPAAARRFFLSLTPGQ